MTSSDLMRLQLAWLDQGLDEYETQLRIESYLEAGLDHDLAVAAVTAELYLDEVRELRNRVEQLEQTVASLTAETEKETDDC